MKTQTFMLLNINKREWNGWTQKYNRKVYKSFGWNQIARKCARIVIIVFSFLLVCFVVDNKFLASHSSFQLNNHFYYSLQKHSDQNCLHFLRYISTLNERREEIHIHDNEEASGMKCYERHSS